MSAKRIVELTCGDPKTNQQTASKAECSITINNRVVHGNKDGAEKSPIIVNDETDYFDDTTTVTVTQDGKTTTQAPSRTPMRDIAGSLFVSRQIKRDEPTQPLAADGYIQTASRPTITEVEITASSSVKDVLLESFEHLLLTNDTALCAQLVGARKAEDRKIILILDDLKKLITAIVNLVDPDFSVNDVKVKVYANDIEVGCCGASSPKTLVNPFNEISSITIGNQDMKIHQFEAYNTIEDKLNVSLQYVYSASKDSEINAEQEQQ